MTNDRPTVQHFDTSPLLYDQESARLLDLLTLVASGLLSFLIFARVPVHALSPGFFSELKSHSLLLKVFPPNVAPYSIWYLLQYILVGGQKDSELFLLNAGFLLLGALSFLKGVVLSGILLAASFSRIQSLFLSLLLGTAVAFPLPFIEQLTYWGKSQWYLGTIPPNVFMSATQLTANIFGVVALYSLSLWFERPTRIRFVLSTFLGVLATAAKPGIAPCWLLALVIMLAILVFAGQYKIKFALTSIFFAIVLIGTPLCVAYYFFMSGREGSARVVLMPLQTWTHYSSFYWFAHLVASWMFPLTVLVALGIAKKLSPLKIRLLLPVWLIALIGTSIFALFAEVDPAGRVLYNGNLIWGAMTACSGLYVVSAIALQDQHWRVKALPFIVLVIQAGTGFSYVSRYIQTGNYL
jgi:hypothetical protein